ncbi:epimerase [Moorena producens PAL-8-15-08-1]|uniref:Epimerase n=1 Tax=Moorena producens PAL-8-15-08-1 TaxID=1458985 RepID=A0A1D8U2M7_9CYAN|nr:SDR family oxidoreductase [Moorena producens]AOX04034.1 epimerase [Moorena producens PAL-8-15-08-1]
MTSTDRALVAGATGGVGQLTVAKLLEKGFQVSVLTRSAEKAQQMFDNRVEIMVGDTRYPSSLPPAIKNVTHIICCTGTTAFPSQKWDFDTIDQAKGFPNVIEWLKIYLKPSYSRTKAKNSPEQVDAIGVRNLVAAAPKDLKRFVFVSSCGVLRKDKPPYSILNSFGVLDAKKKAEEIIINSGLPYTIIRAGRLIDGPFTSYDLNTLLKATTAGKLGLVLGTGDTLSGQASRIDVASACVESIANPVTVGKVFELINQGARPSVIDWAELFSTLD